MDVLDCSLNPLPESDDLQRWLRESGHRVVRPPPQRGGAPVPVDGATRGLLLVTESSGGAPETEALCRALDLQRDASRTLMVVAARELLAEPRRAALLQAGADEVLQWPAQRELLEARIARLESRLEATSPLRTGMSSRLELLAAGTAQLTGLEFLRALAVQMTQLFGATTCCVGRILPGQRQVRTLVNWSHGALQPGVLYELAGTPCDRARAQEVCHFRERVADAFPQDAFLREHGIESYLGVALADARGAPCGVLALLHTAPMEVLPGDLALLQWLAGRAGAELERMDALAEVESAHQFLSAVIDAAPDALYVKDGERRVRIANAAFYGLLGLTPEQVIGQPRVPCLSEAEIAAFRAQDEACLRTGKPTAAELSVTDASGHQRTVHAHKAVFRGASGEPLLVGMLRDLTEQRRLEAQMRLADRMSSVGTLAAGVAHEINNPLAYLIGNVTYVRDILRDRVSDGASLESERRELLEALGEALHGAERVRATMGDLKLFSRADEDTLGPVDVNAVVQSSLRMVRSQLQHRAELQLRLGALPTVRGNDSRLGQVCVNLMVNALQALPERPQAQNLLRVETSATADEVCLVVADNGPGIPAALRERIFDPFFTTKPVGVGTGLGLSICLGIVRSLGGQLEVESSPEQGALFRVRLPVAAEGDAVLPAPPEVQVEPALRLLVVDDEEKQLAMLRRLLGPRHELVAHVNPAEALAAVASDAHFDAVLCDVVMPQMSGVEFHARLGKLSPRLAERTAFLTGGVFTTEAKHFLDARADRVLEKPFTPAALDALLAKLLYGATPS